LEAAGFAEAADCSGLEDLFPPGALVSDQLPGAEDAPDFRGSDDQVVVAAEGAACVASEGRGADWYCEAAPGFAPLDHGDALGAVTAGWRGAAAGAEPLRLKVAGCAVLTGAIGAC
jgi:hypothetical protein